MSSTFQSDGLKSQKHWLCWTFKPPRVWTHFSRLFFETDRRLVGLCRSTRWICDLILRSLAVPWVSSWISFCFFPSLGSSPDFRGVKLIKVIESIRWSTRNSATGSSQQGEPWKGDQKQSLSPKRGIRKEGSEKLNFHVAQKGLNTHLRGRPALAGRPKCIHVIYIYIYTSLSLSLYIYICICMCVYIYTYIYINIHAYIHISLSLSISLSIYIYIHTYIYLSLSLYIYICI